MRIAIVHDWMTLSGGAEKVLEAILRMYPSADLFCVVDFLPEAERGYLKNRKITTTFIQNLPFARSKLVCKTYFALHPHLGHAHGKWRRCLHGGLEFRRAPYKEMLWARCDNRVSARRVRSLPSEP